MTYYLGRMVKSQRHGWSVWSAMALFFLIGFLICSKAEFDGNPRMHALGVEASCGNMEGKEVRFGIFGSALWATVTTDTSCGAVNSMHDSYTPIGGFIPLLNIMLGCLIFGGVGAGLFAMLVFVVLAVFIAGLMVGRSPEYLGNKIDAYDVKACVFYIITAAFGILWMTGWAVVSKWGIAGLNNSGPHGFTEILYAYSQAIANNGSAFAGLNANTYWLDTTIGLAMLVGRYFMIIPVMALAGHIAGKKRVAITGGSFPVAGPLFTVLLMGTIFIIGALIFFPALSLGPILEHFLMTRTNLLF
jgi:potassium-transporting ATPase potassium-binding subunit